MPAIENRPYLLKYIKHPFVIWRTYNNTKRKDRIYFENIAEGYADNINHSHSELELLYVTDGRAELTVSNREYRLSRGDLLVINPFEPHRLTYTSQEIEYGHKRIKFALSIIDDQSDPYIKDVLGRLESGRLKIKNLYRNGENGSYSMVSCFNQIYGPIEFLIPGWEFGMKAGMNGLLARIICDDNLIENKDGANQSDNLFIMNVSAYIDEHMSEDISTDTAAAALGYSISYFCRLFRRLFRSSFIYYLNLIRINTARRRILEGDTNIMRIAMECGYNTPSYFSKEFKKYLGATPSQFCLIVAEKDYTWEIKYGSGDSEENSNR